MKWILHNCIIFNGGNILLNCINKIVQFILFRAVLQYMELILRWLNNFVVGGKLTAAAKLIVKIAKHETSEVEICPECYLNSYLKKNNNWFCEPCVSTKLLHSCFPPFQLNSELLTNHPINWNRQELSQSVFELVCAYFSETSTHAYLGQTKRVSILARQGTKRS